MSDTSEIDRQEQRKKGSVPVPGAILPHLDKCALLFDIDGTLIDLAPTPDGIFIPPELPGQLEELWRRTSGALALVSGRMISDIDQIMKPIKLPAVGGHGVEMRLSGRRRGAGGGGEADGSAPEEALHGDRQISMPVS